jgi:Undecaprenyl-phosphate glucose phosphotransferase
MLKKHGKLLANLLLLGDVVLVACSWLLAYYLRFRWAGRGWSGAPSLSQFTVYLVPIVAIWMVVLRNMGLYKSRRLAPLREEIFDIVRSSTLALIILIGVAFFMKKLEPPRLMFLYFWSVSIVLLCLERALFRLALRVARKSGYNFRRILIIGAGKLGREAAQKIKANSWMGLSITGFLDDHKPLDQLICGERVLGKIDDVEAVVQANKIDHVFLTLPARAHERLGFVLEKLGDKMVNVSVIPDIYQAITLNAGVSELDGLPVIDVIDSPMYGWNSVLKRFADLAFAFIAVVVAAPAMLAIAVAIKLTSKGPVFFRQRRYGMDGKVIQVLKFRTMSVCEDGADVPQAKQCDPRVTRVGAFLRRTSLDELPQFFNVLAGDMSVVGPRPHAVAHNELYKKLIKNYMLRHKVKPGITGWAQINGWRGETDTVEKMESRVKYDLFYIENWSVWFDIKIMWLTVVKGFAGKNAY